MANYIIYGANLSGMVAFSILKEHEHTVIGFIDQTGEILDPRLRNEYQVIKNVGELDLEKLKAIDVILIAVGSIQSALTIKESLGNIDVKVETIYDKEFNQLIIDKKEKVLEEINETMSKNPVIKEVVVGETQCKIECDNLIESERARTLAGERDIFNFLNDKIDSDMIIYDVGANIGLYSLFLGKKLNNGIVYSFEPEDKNYAKLIHNIALNGMERNIIPKKVALGSRCERKKLFLNSTHVGEGGNSFVNAQGKNYIFVDVYDLDSYVQTENLPLPDIVKIDVEGFEFEVLLGMKDIIKIKRPILLIEVHLSQLNQLYCNIDIINTFLKDCNYVIHKLDVANRNEIFLYAFRVI